MAKPYRGVAMEGRVARWYDGKAGILTCTAHWPIVWPNTPTPSRSFSITGLDISDTFVSLARDNGARQKVAVESGAET